MKFRVLLLLALAGPWLSTPGLAQSPAQKIVLITIDGLRPTEVFTGADSRLMISELGVGDPTRLNESYGGDTGQQRREKLLPYLWSRIDTDGWIAGDVDQDSIVHVTNGKYFSYPGYNELLTGFADDRVSSNDKNYNENQTVLEWLNKKPSLNGSVMAFGSWDLFPFIINDRRSGVPVNAGWMPLTVGSPETLKVLNHTAGNLFHQWSNVRYDVFTAAGAIEAMKTAKPRVLYVSLGETDDWAHAGRYDRYLLAAHQNDRFIRELWEETEKHEEYRGKTAFLIATDHGRGDGREAWKSHGDTLPGSERIWIAAFGAGVSARGIDRGGRFQQGQIAATVASLLGYDFQESNAKIAPPLPIIKNDN